MSSELLAPLARYTKAPQPVGGKQKGKSTFQAAAANYKTFTDCF